MCTVSIIGLTRPASNSGVVAGGFRLITNRDELRTRPLATGPRWHDAVQNVVASGDPQAAAVFPVDPAGGGTWVAASAGGVVLCLLNANPWPAPELPRGGGLLSRGVIIPRLLGEHGGGGLEGVMSGLGAFALERFAPFRLVGVEMEGGGAGGAGGAGGGFRVREAMWDRVTLTETRHEAGPVCFVSSALGDPLVRPRLSLFDAMVRGVSGGATQGLAQGRFHRHAWAGRSEISVLMSRADARTVSITSVDVEPGVGDGGAPAVTMRYDPVIEPAETVAPSLALRRSPI